MMLEASRKDFPVLERKIDEKPIIYLDNAATSLTPLSVLEAMQQYYTHYTANVHRGIHKLSEEASEEYELAHETVEKFVQAKNGEIAFTKGTTESINSVMYSLLFDHFFQPGDEILVSKAEHHANLVPWQFVCQQTGAKLRLIELNSDFTLNLQDFEQKLTKKTKLVSMAHATNTTGAIFPISEIGKRCQENNSLFLVDAAQSAPHFPLNVQKLNCDFLAFSGHKMLGPTGIGVLFGKKEHLEKLPPFQYGGAMIQSVSYESAQWNKLPDKFEAGTPPIAEAIGLKAAIEYLQKIGMQNIFEHGKKLSQYAIDKISSIEQVQTYHPQAIEKQGSALLFGSQKLAAHEIGIALDEMENIAIRTGMMCAQPFIESLNPEGLCRASFYLYNTKKEIDLLAETLQTVLDGLG